MVPAGQLRKQDLVVEASRSVFWAEEWREPRAVSERAFDLYRCSFVVMLSCWTACLSFSPQLAVRCGRDCGAISLIPLEGQSHHRVAAARIMQAAKASLIRPSRGVNRPDTRSRTAAVCPFKSFGRKAVLPAGKAARQPGGGALIAQCHGNHCRAAGAREIVARIEQNAKEQQSNCGWRQPMQTKRRGRFGWSDTRLIARGGGCGGGKNPALQASRRVAWRPRTQLCLQVFQFAHTLLLSGSSAASAVHIDSGRRPY